MATIFDEWDGSIAMARRLQTQWAQHVVLRDPPAFAPRLVAGLDVGFEANGTITRAAVVLLDMQTLQPIQAEVARIPTSMPYIPGLLSFRELPALLAVLATLRHRPDLVFVDGHGIAHPRRLGIAAHLGVVTALPSIGVAKKLLTGHYSEPDPEPGARTPLLDGDTQIGWVLRSKRRCKPLFISPGHRISLASAVDWTQRCLTTYRIPEPTRLADRLASNRGPMPSLQMAVTEFFPSA